MRARNSVGISIASIIVAVSAFVLPALDAKLPGGSLPWQIAVLLLAIAGAWWVVRGSNLTTTSPRRIARLIAGLVIIAALVWVGGVVLLWLIWPR